ncbi:Serine hydrolase (FSH1) [Marinomonas spartinae]|nr:Serine hydrolase (FSH1) [Marinomonas spartinae]
MIGGVATYFYCDAIDSQRLRNAKFLGDKDSHSVVIYLHGMDLPNVSDQELANRQKLDEIGHVLSIKFYLPRSVTKCHQNDNQLCWPQDNVDELERTLSTITSSANFERGDKLEGIIGFSNGGFFTSKLIQNCLLPDDFWVVSIGSAGAWGDSEKDLSNCGRVISIIGKNDRWHYSYMLNFHRYLQSVGAKSKLIEFNGGHAMPLSELKRELALLLTKNQ